MKKILDIVLEILFPRKCKVCKSTQKINEYNICPVCEANIKPIFYQCKKCGEPGYKQMETCHNCKSTKIFYDATCIPFYYQGAIKKLIHSFKYSKRCDISNYFYSLLINNKRLEVYFKKNKWDYFIPVPLHKSRLRERGYNQSFILAEILNSIFCVSYAPIPILDNTLIRTKKTKPLFDLNKEERLKQLSGAFKLDEKKEDMIKNKNILLIDDIMTTGSTLNECAKILKEKRAKTVDLFALSHD
jgi:competence protein ComFC